ncbi:MAG: SDR family oxidoreductase [bacterium]
MQKIILITGSTDGIGKTTAKLLAKNDNKIIIHGRNEEKCVNTVNEIIKAAGNKNIEYVIGDFASLNSVKKMADDVLNKYPYINVLINNAGIYAKNKVLTVDGFESTFAVNHLAPFLLTGLLLPLLKKGSPSRIINVSSAAHKRAKLDINDLNLTKSFEHYFAYANSKLANVLFSNYLAEKVKNKNITVNSLHPGVIGTKLLKEGFGMKGAGLEEGAATSVYLAESEEINSISGKYFIDKTEVPSSNVSYKKELQQKLWEISEKYTGIKF